MNDVVTLHMIFLYGTCPVKNALKMLDVHQRFASNNLLSSTCKR